VPHDFLGWLGLIVCVVIAIAVAVGAAVRCWLVSAFESAVDQDDECYLTGAEAESGRASAPAVMSGQVGGTGWGSTPGAALQCLPRDPLRVVTWHPWGSLAGNARQRRIERRCQRRARAHRLAAD
jgi:hypothetical protein